MPGHEGSSAGVRGYKCRGTRAIVPGYEGNSAAKVSWYEGNSAGVRGFRTGVRGQ